MTEAYTHRFVQFCRIRHGGDDPDEVMGALVSLNRLCLFSLWIQEKWRQWFDEQGRGSDARPREEDHSRFDAWLETLKPER